jgi:hypothetical protein
VVPVVVERLEDDLEVLTAQAVEVGDDGVEFVDFLLLFVVIKRSIVDADRIGPVLITLVDSRETAREFDDTLAKVRITTWAGDRKRLENLECDTGFYKPTRIQSNGILLRTPKR